MAGGKPGVEIHAFTDLDREGNLAPYISALEIFDARPQLQELKVLARAHIHPGDMVLDVGCGFGLESLKLAPLVEPGGKVTGIDKSADHRHRCVNRSVIHHKQLEIFKGLPQDTLDRLANQVGSIVCGYDNTYFWHVKGETRFSPRRPQGSMMRPGLTRIPQSQANTTRRRNRCHRAL